MVRRRFTPELANKSLPLVKRIVADILDRGRRLKRELAERTPSDTDAEQRIAVLRKELLELIDELERIGCFYRDPGFGVGLVDFPAEIDGQPVHLCWRSDEDSVRYYHPVNSGYVGRRPIPEHELAKHASDMSDGIEIGGSE